MVVLPLSLCLTDTATGHGSCPEVSGDDSEVKTSKISDLFQLIDSNSLEE